MNEHDIRHYTHIAEFLGNTLGPDYEIVLYDLKHILTIINGHISGQKSGEAVSGTIKNIINKKDYKNKDWISNYRGLSANGKILRCSSLYIKNEAGKLVGFLNINFDDNRYRELSKQVFALCHPDSYVSKNISIEIRGTKEQELFSENIASALDEILSRTGNENLFNELSHSEKIDITRQLYLKGIFSMKGAVKAVGQRLSCSQASMYRYLNIVKKEVE